MKYDLEQAPDIHTVHSFAWDSVWIGERLQTHSFIITPHTVITDWSARAGNTVVGIDCRHLLDWHRTPTIHPRHGAVQSVFESRAVH